MHLALPNKAIESYSNSPAFTIKVEWIEPWKESNFFLNEELTWFMSTRYTYSKKLLHTLRYIHLKVIIERLNYLSSLVGEILAWQVFLNRKIRKVKIAFLYDFSISFRVNCIEWVEFNIHRSIENPMDYKLVLIVIHNSKELKNYEIWKSVKFRRKIDFRFFYRL